MRKFIIYVSVLLFFLSSGCDKMDTTFNSFADGKEIRYSKKPDLVGVYTGNQKARLWLVNSSPNVVKGKIFWNDGMDSVEFPIKSIRDTTFISVNNIGEGSHTFVFYTYDLEDNLSMPMEANGFVYGSAYVQTLSNRSYKSGITANDRSKILFVDAHDATMLGSELYWKSKDGTETSLFLPPNENELLIEATPLGDSILYRTIFLPDKKSLDTFYTGYDKITLEEISVGLLNEGLFSPISLPNDNKAESGHRLEALWDGDLTTREGAWRTATSTELPIVFTIDLGMSYNVTKFRIWQWFSAGLYYANANIKEFELWGSDNPAEDGSWDSWSKLGDFEVLKPSEHGGSAADDLEAGQNGHEFDIASPQDAISVRFIRFKVLSTWTVYAAPRILLQEAKFYGIPAFE